MNGRDNAANAVKGVKLGVAGGTGPLNSTGRTTAAVALGQATPPPTQRPAAVAAATSQLGPKVLFKPRPEFTAEAIKLHIEGTISVRIQVSASGVVKILGITSGLGHGLDESAERAVMATRFEPATDGSGTSGIRGLVKPEHVNRNRSLIAGLLTRQMVIGTFGTFEKSPSHPLPGASAPRLSDVPRVHDLTVEDLTRCHHEDPRVQLLRSSARGWPVCLSGALSHAGR
jgi:TonB family protein